MQLLVQCKAGSTLVVLHCDGHSYTVPGRAEARWQEGWVVRTAAFINTEVLTVVLSAACYQQAVQEGCLWHPQVTVTCTVSMETKENHKHTHTKITKYRNPFKRSESISSTWAVEVNLVQQSLYPPAVSTLGHRAHLARPRQVTLATFGGRVVVQSDRGSAFTIQTAVRHVQGEDVGFIFTQDALSQHQIHAVTSCGGGGGIQDQGLVVQRHGTPPLRDSSGETC